MIKLPEFIVERKTLFIFSAAALIAVIFSYFILFGAPQRNSGLEQFTVPLHSNNAETISNLKERGFIKNSRAFGIVLGLRGAGGNLQPGGYKISKSMNAWEIAGVFAMKAYTDWAVISEGLRKEEIADILAKNLSWSEAEKQEWIKVDTATSPDYIEGVYFPDTYLIPADESPADVAKRLQSKFQEEFAPYAKEAIKQNIKWTTVLKIASIVQREAAGKTDMPVIAGILWNRLSDGMKLQIDATVQYARGDAGKGWWAPISPADKKIDSPYNTYLYAGLPPHPISNPGIDAISAVLNPQKTNCLYYLHDSAKVIHCAATYDEHLKNISKYLR